MENNELHDPWVDRRISALDPPTDWQPNTAQAFARFRDRQKAYRAQRTRWTWAAIAASVTAVGLLLVAPAPCSGAGCVKTVAPSPQHNAVAVSGPAVAPVTVTPAVPKASDPAPAPASPVAAKPQARPATGAPTAVRSFKESGNAVAPITVEIYSDYECPHCATVFLQVMPGVVRDYVKTGKIRLVHRDFPLPMHPSARIAARYANAAGMLGYYDVVVDQIFRTQSTWAQTGDVGSQVALVLPTGVMNQVREMVQNDPRLDESVDGDIAAGRQDQLTMTPTMVVVYKGKRQMLAPVPQYELLKSYFDELLTK